MSDRSRAEQQNEHGRALLSAGQLPAAEQAFRQACESDPTWSVPWYNLGLLYKYEARWPESLEANSRAVALDATEIDAWWNLGIAATAVHDWATARRAWSACGIAMPDGADPLELGYGLVAVRLNPRGKGEVVWANRTDPARAVIRNVPYPESGFREGDIVLHDGAVTGKRMVNGQERPVFDALAVWRRSDRSTFEVHVRARRPADIDELHEIADELSVVLEDWTKTVRCICRRCSEGTPHDEHVWTESWDTQRRIGVSAADRAVVDRIVEEWSSRDVSREIVRIDP